MYNQIQMVREFHEAFGAPTAKYPMICSPERLALRYKLIHEETQEFGVAAGQLVVLANGGTEPDPANMVEMADALMDLLYVTYGTILELGLEEVAEKMFARVHASNMSKLGLDGKPLLREDGKILKGPNFFKPNLAAYLPAEVLNS